MDNEYVIFASPDVQMEANDRAVVITKQGQTFEGIISKTFAYSSHGETGLKVEKKA